MLQLRTFTHLCYRLLCTLTLKVDSSSPSPSRQTPPHPHPQGRRRSSSFGEAVLKEIIKPELQWRALESNVNYPCAPPLHHRTSTYQENIRYRSKKAMSRVCSIFNLQFIYSKTEQQELTALDSLDLQYKNTPYGNTDQISPRAQSRFQTRGNK